MTTGRWFGPALLDRFGRVASVRTSAVVACGGALLVVFAWSLPFAMPVRRCGGSGAPSASRRHERRGRRQPVRGRRVGVVTSIGYVAFLAGPPFVGLLATRSAPCTP